MINEALFRKHLEVGNVPLYINVPSNLRIEKIYCGST